jgi:hypothetical protein
MTISTEHDREIHELAELLIGRCGERARSYATHQSFEAGHRGDQRAMEAWLRIADAAEQVWKVEPARQDERSRWRAIDLRNYLTVHARFQALRKIIGRAVEELRRSPKAGRDAAVDVEAVTVQSRHKM